MDKQQEQLEFLGFIGVLKESIKIILSHPKIFTKITLAFILPLTLIVLINNEISMLLSNKIFHNSSTSNTQESSPNDNASKLITSKWVLYWGIEAAYFFFIFVIIFSLLAISVVVYTVACIYTGKHITFKQVMTAVPKVWKRLLITLFSNFCIILAYTIIILLFTFVIIHGISSIHQSDTRVGLTITIIIMAIILTLGIIYLTIFWQLANVISVMEDCYGFKAMKKSKQLIKGKFGTAIAIFLLISLFNVPIILLNRQLFSSNINTNIATKIICVIISLILNPLITLYSLVVQTIFYCVCKSYHHEIINKSTLNDHLEAFLGDNVPLLTPAVELA